MIMRERKTNRLKDYDYTQNGHYFVTGCVKDRQECLGVVEGGRTVLNEYGEIVCACWEDLPNHYGNVKLDVFVIMPNHFHGIVVIQNNVGNGLKPFPTHHGLSEIMRGFKTFSSRKINKVGNGFKPFPTNMHKFQWQKSFYDHIIRDEIDLNRIRGYIVNNPANWPEDENNPLKLQMG